MDEVKCTECGAATEKVMFKIFPMRICVNRPQCSLLRGFWAFTVFVLPFNGEFIQYDSYFNALRMYFKYDERKQFVLKCLKNE